MPYTTFIKIIVPGISLFKRYFANKNNMGMNTVANAWELNVEFRKIQSKYLNKHVALWCSFRGRRIATISSIMAPMSFAAFIINLECYGFPYLKALAIKNNIRIDTEIKWSNCRETQYGVPQDTDVEPILGTLTILPWKKNFENSADYGPQIWHVIYKFYDKIRRIWISLLKRYFAHKKQHGNGHRNE